MRQGPTPAAESIFLDYLSQWNLISLYKSIRKRHFLVSLCVAGSLLLNVVTVLSTGLFELDTVPITRNVELTATHTFDASNWDPVWNDGRPMGACLGYMDEKLARPMGIHDPYVYPPFQNSDRDTTENSTIDAGVEYKAELDVFEPTLECSEADVKLVPSHDSYAFDQLDSYVGKDGCSVVIDGIPNVLTITPGIVVDTMVAGCKGEMLDNMAQDAPNVSWAVDWRLWAAIAPSMVKSEEDSLTGSFNKTGWEHRKIKVLMCKPDYNISRGPVKVWRDPGQNDISSSIQPEALTPIPGLNNVTGAKLLYAASRAVIIGSSEFTESYVNGAGEIYASNNTRKQLWNDPQKFKAAIQDSFTCIMRQIVKDSLLVNRPHNLEGTEQMMEPRLFVRPLSFWLMAVLMGFLAVTAGLLLWLYTPVAVCPRDTGSIAGLSLVLSRSSGFMARFCGSDLKTEAQMEHSFLGRGRYQTQISETGEFSLISCDDSLEPQSDEFERTRVLWWRPASSSLYIQLPLIIIPLAVIVGLEIVYHISVKNHGIALIQGESPYIHYVWVYVPAVILFGIRCFFQSIEFGARIVQPYFRLRQTSAPPETSILENQLRKVSIYGVWDSLRKRQWALTAATLSLLLGAVLPIVVSGLYTTAQSEPETDIQLVQGTRWNLGDPQENRLATTAYWNNENFKKDTATGMIIHLNLSYPQWTHKDLAFPTFSLVDADNIPQKGHINARLPALRGQLNCSRAVGVHWEYKGDSIPENTWEGHKLTDCPSWLNSVPCPGEEEYTFKGTGDYMEGCPTHAMLYTKCDPQNPYYNNTANFNVMDCFADIEEVDVDVRLQVPSFSFDPDHDPRVVEGSSRKNIKTGLASFINFKDMEKYLFDIKPLTGSYPEAADGNPVMDALIHGIDGVPANELMNPEKLVSRVNEIFGIITAQALNNAGHESFDKPFNQSWSISPMTHTPPVYEATFYDERRYLVQNEISTRILDGVLAAMVLCAIASMIFMQRNRVLPKCPCTIAAVASLLHGSKLVDPDFIPQGSEWYDDKELKSAAVFTGHTFTMGWWAREKRSDGGDLLNSGESSSSLSNVSSSASQQKDGHGKIFGIDFDLDEEKSNLIRSRS